VEEQITKEQAKAVLTEYIGRTNLSPQEKEKLRRAIVILGNVGLKPPPQSSEE
jgi:hypothetical protein